MPHRLSRLLSPRTIAIVGASERVGSIAATTRNQLVEAGFAGRIFAVNPKYTMLFGEICYPDIAALPEVPDLAVFAISGLALEGSFEEALEKGIGGALIYAANHLEEDSEPSLNERLRQKACAAGIPVCGGNSMGFYNYDNRVMVSFDRPPAGRPAGHIGLILHSGSAMTYLANNDARFRFNYVIASGQEISASVGDYMDYLLEQPTTRVVAVVLEAVRDVAAFVGALGKAREKDIPVVIARLGRSARSAEFARSHSGAIVGNHEAFVALCRRHGVILARDADELIVTAMLFAAGLRAGSGKLASMLDSGGMREQMIDLAEEIGVEFAVPAQATLDVLRGQLEAGLEAVNPMDGMGALGRNSRHTFLECGKALLDDPDTGLLSFEFEFRDGFSHYPELFDVARELTRYNGKPVVLINSCSFASIDTCAAELSGEGIAVVNGIDLALRALRNLMQYRGARSDAQVTAGAVAFEAATIEGWRARLVGGREPGEPESLALLADAGFPAVEFACAESEAELLSVAGDFDYPLVLKTAVEGIDHKSDCDGVRLGIDCRERLLEAYRDLAGRLGPRVVVMPMVESGIEVAIGMKNDAQYGPLIVVGCGGVLVELFVERAFRLAPVDAGEAGAMIDETRLARLLEGVRGRPPADREGLIELIVRFSAFVMELSDCIAEIDLNPVIVNRQGCRIVDALIVPQTSN